MHPHEEVPAIPLWINGRACLKLTSGFHDVRNPVNGETLRRIPLCGQAEVREALQSAQLALASWSAMDTSARKELLAALGNALSQLSGHFSRLIAEETGKDEKLAREEIASTVSLLRHAQEDGTTGIAAVAGTSSEPLLGVVRSAIPALASGTALLVCPALESPSAMLALSELSGRCGFPAGVINVIYLDPGSVAELPANPGIALLP